MNSTLMNISHVINTTTITEPVKVIEPLNIVTIIFCIVIILTGVIGNVMVLVVFGGGWVKAKSCGVYLINMAFANLIGTTIIPTELILELVHYGIRPIGDVGCKMLSFLSTTSISVSSFSLVLISIDRYIVMRRPTRNALSPPVMMLVLSVIWILGSSVGIIYLMGDRVRLHHVGDYSVCRSFALHGERVVHTVVTLSLQVLIPLLVMFVMYTVMIVQIKPKSMYPLLKEGDKSREHFERYKNAIRILLLIVVVFFVCQIPVNVFYLYDLFHFNTLSISVSLRIYTFLHMLQMASNCINPIIYFAFSRYLAVVTAGNGGVHFMQNEAYVIE